MGCYVNPQLGWGTKEEFLREFGIQTRTPCEITETHLPVCLVDNGPFTAAGVGFCKEEVDAFMHPDARDKQWFRVSREDLRKVSDLAEWEARYGA